MACSYFLNENWGLQLEVLSAINQDRSERFCLEHFYNDPQEKLGVSCAQSEDDLFEPLYEADATTAIKGVNVGPAYTSIRELDQVLSINATYNPVYGKQLTLMNFITHFDIFFTFGLGAARSTHYPKSLYLRNGTLARGPFPAELPSGCPASPGVCPDNNDALSQIGEAGRPDAEDDIHATLNLGVGQRFHLTKNLITIVELRNFTLLGTEFGVEPFIGLWLGIGASL